MRETTLSPLRQAALSSSAQVGFVIGAPASAVLGLADRFDLRGVCVAAAIGRGGFIKPTRLTDCGKALSYLRRMSLEVALRRHSNRAD